MKKQTLAQPQKYTKKLGLKYVSDNDPGFSRKKVSKGFIYYNHKGKRILDKKTLLRIHKIVIPQAWKDVWVCRFENGHIQATGRDVRGRKQYKYHADWSAARNQDKFHKLAVFGKVLGKLRRQIKKDLARKGLPREKVIASVLKVMEITNIRVGNDTYARENHSYGLTTIRNNHVKVGGSKVQFHFKGKSGVVNATSFEDRRLSKIIKNCQELPGQELFGYKDEDGKVHDITSDDVNSYIREVTGEDLSAKDFRTWAGSCNALKILLDQKDVKEISETAWKKRQVDVIKETAEALLNTVAVCRKYYIHPEVFEACRKGLLQSKKNHKMAGLDACESLLMNLVS